MSSIDGVLEAENLTFNDPPHIAWVKVREAVGLLWAGNPKMHDLGAVIQSIERYGFQELPKFDAALPNVGGGQGAIKAGNGRVEALAAMEKDGYGLPRGLAVEAEGGAWAMPLLVGTDADSLEAAKAYAIDSNNLTMLGGDFDPFDLVKMWEPGYADLLLGLGQAEKLPVSVDGEFLDTLLQFNKPPSLDDLEGKYGDPMERDFWPVIRVQVAPEIFELYQSFMAQLPGADEAAKFAKLMEAVDAGVLGTGLP